MVDHKSRERTIKRYISMYKYLGLLPARYEDSGSISFNRTASCLMWFMVVTKALWQIYFFLFVQIPQNWGIYLLHALYAWHTMMFIVFLFTSRKRVRMTNEVVKEIRKIDELFNFSWSANQYNTTLAILFGSSWLILVPTMVYDTYYIWILPINNMWLKTEELIAEVSRVMICGFQWSFGTQVAWLLLRLGKVHKKLERVQELQLNDKKTIESTIKLLRTSRLLCRNMMNEWVFAVAVDVIGLMIGLTAMVFFTTLDIVGLQLGDVMKNLTWIFANFYNFIAFLKVFDNMEHEMAGVSVNYLLFFIQLQFKLI